MAQILPTNIPILTANAIASYDYVDLSSGLGFINFKGFTTCLSGATGYNLGTGSYYSFTTGTTDAGGPGPDTVINFDSSAFNMPRTCKGTAYASIPFGIANAGTGNIQVQLMKSDGTTVTNLSDQLSGANVGGAGADANMFLIPLPLTQTVIKVGEFLRLAVTAWGDGANVHEIGHDPQGRSGVIISGATVTTALNLYVPFRIYN